MIRGARLPPPLGLICVHHLPIIPPRPAPDDLTPGQNGLFPRSEPMDVAPGIRHHPRTRPTEPSTEAQDPAIMDAFVIRGGKPLKGRVQVSGAKNAALPVMAATLLTPGVHTLRNVPVLRDTITMGDVLQKLGARVELGPRLCKIDTTNITSVEAPYDLVRTMRASIYVLGPLLARYGNARVSLPGGCAWGPRPVNLHLEGLKAMSAALEIEHGYIVGREVK